MKKAKSKNLLHWSLLSRLSLALVMSLAVWVLVLVVS